MGPVNIAARHQQCAPSPGQGRRRLLVLGGIMSCVSVRYWALFSGTKFLFARFLLHFRCSPAWINTEF